LQAASMRRMQLLTILLFLYWESVYNSDSSSLYVLVGNHMEKH
jgi:hypothetical protein